MRKFSASTISSLVLLAIFYFCRPSAFEQAIQNFPNISLDNSLIYILLVNLVIFIVAQSQSSEIAGHTDNSSLIYGGLIGSATLSTLVLSFYFLNLGFVFTALGVPSLALVYSAFGPGTYISLVLFSYLIVFGSTLFAHQRRAAIKSEPSTKLKSQNLLGQKKILISELKLLFLSNKLDTYELDVAGGEFFLANPHSTEYISALKKIHELVLASNIRLPSDLKTKLNQFSE